MSREYIASVLKRLRAEQGMTSVKSLERAERP